MRSSEVRYLEVDDVLALHELVLEVGGGAAGVRDHGQVHAVMIGIATGRATRDDLADAFSRAMGGDRVQIHT